MSPAPINKMTALSNSFNMSILFSSISDEPSIRSIKSCIVNSPVFSLIEPKISHKNTRSALLKLDANSSRKA